MRIFITLLSICIITGCEEKSAPNSSNESFGSQTVSQPLVIKKSPPDLKESLQPTGTSKPTAMGDFQFNLDTSKETPAQKLQKAYDKKDYKTALSLLKERNREQPDNAKLLSQIGTCYFQLEDFSRALPYVNRSLKSDPEYLPALRLLSVLQLQRKRYRDSIETCTKVLEKSPQDAQVLIWKATALLSTNQAEAAMKDINTVLTLPEIDQGNTYYLKAAAHLQLKQFSDAADAITQARSLKISEEKLSQLEAQMARLR